MVKKIIIVIVVLALAGGGWYFYNRYTATQKAQAASVSIQTVALEKSSLVNTISATGNLRSAQSAILTWQTSGTVDRVNVKAGDQVNGGQTLATLSQTSLPQSVITAQSDLISGQTALDNLTTQAATLKAQALANIATYEGNLKDAQYNLDNFTVPTSQANLSTTDALQKTKANLDAARKAFDPYKFTASTDSTRTSLKKTLDNAQADYNAAVKRLNLEYQLEVANANLKQAWDNYNKYKDGPAPEDVAAAQAKIAAAQAAINQALMTSPITGTVTVVDAQVGDQVKSGVTAFRVDDLSKMYVDVNVSEVDISNIRAGQPVTVTFDALRKKPYQGVVDSVAMISQSGTTTVNFTVTVRLTNADSSVLSGMTAVATIEIARKDNVLVVPLQSVTSKGGKQLVYVVRPGQQAAQPVPVDLGTQSSSYAELLGTSLKVGDRVVVDPSKLTGAQAATGNQRFLFGGGPGGGGGGGNRSGGGGGGAGGGNRPGGD